MNEWLKKLTDSVSNFWKNSSAVKKGIFFVVIAVIIVVIVATTRISSKPAGVRVFNSQVTDETQQTKILDRISQENVEAHVDENGYIIVDDAKTARTLRSVLVADGLVPSNIDPFAGFYNRTWSVTDKEQDVKLQNATIEQVKKHLEALNGIDRANVTLTFPKDVVFSDDQEPVTASIILKASANSDILQNRKSIEGIQRLVLAAINGLKAENLIIADEMGKQLNDFEGMADFDRQSLIKQQQEQKRKLELTKKADILKALQKIATADRVRDLLVSVDFDQSEISREKTEYKPIERKADNPDTPYDDSEYVDSIPVSEQIVTKEWQGTGYNPEGPAGVEGQTPPVYSDMSNVIGKSTETGTTRNNAINETRTKETVAPQTGKTTVSVNVDGVWNLVRDPKTHKYVLDDDENSPTYGGLKRTYTPVSDEDIAQYQKLIEGAIGFNKTRGDSVHVGRIQIDRKEEQDEFDAAYFRAEQRNRTIIIALIAVAVILIGFALFRIVSKELERRRRLREEELLRQQQAEREKALWEARDDANMQVTMSVEESRRAELQENAINMAKEHPEDVAMLIRTWLMEE